MNDPRDEAAQLLDDVAEELEQCEAHVRVAAQHRAPVRTSGPPAAIS